MLSNRFPQTDRNILLIVKILLGLCLITPLFISSSLLFPYTSAKAFAFRILIEISAAFYFYLALKYPEFRPKKSLLNLAILTFLFTSILSAIFGVDFYLSFWGNLERMVGFWGLLHFVLFFFLLAAVFKKGKDWLNLLKISVGASSLVSFLALVQALGGWGMLLPFEQRVFGTLGNPAYLAGYLIFNIFFAGYLFALSIKQAESKKWEKFIWGAAIFLQFIVIFLTGTRGALVGLLFGTIFFIICLAIFHPQARIKKYFLVALILIFILGGFIFAFRQNDFIKNNSFLGRLASVSFKEVTVQNRLILWQSSWQAWQERPIFGWGLENFEPAINKYFDARLNPYEAWYDRAHNFLFDYGIADGWIGLASYLFLIGAAAFYLKRVAKQNFYFSIFFGGLLLAYLVQNLFIFDNFASYLMLFFVLVLISFVYEQTIASQKKTDRDLSQKIGNTNLNFLKKLAVLVLTVLAAFSIYFLNIEPMAASHQAQQTLSLPPEELNQTPLLAQALSQKNFGRNEIVYQVVLDYLDKIQAMPSLVKNEDFYKLGSSALDQSIGQEPLEIRSYVALAWLNLYFSSQDTLRIDLAISQADKIKALSPNKKDSYFLLVAAYAMKNDQINAQAQIESLRKFDQFSADQLQNYYNKLK